MSHPAGSPACRQRATAASYPKSTSPAGPPTPNSIPDAQSPPPAMPYSVPYHPHPSGYPMPPGAHPDSILMPPPVFTTHSPAIQSSPGFGTPDFSLYPTTAYPSGSYFPDYGSLVQFTVPNLMVARQDSFDSDADTTSYDVPSGIESDTKPSPSKASNGKNHTPRPPNAWILYRSDKLRAIAAGAPIPGLEAVMTELGVATSSSSADETDAFTKAKKSKNAPAQPGQGLLSLGRGKSGRGLPQADISKMISMLWKRESPAIRAEYEKRSAIKKQEHAEKYPEYKFQPMRKIDKIKLKEEKEREKEAARREKELHRSGGRRRNRARTKLSPPTPYLEPGSRSMARSLTYGGSTSSEVRSVQLPEHNHMEDAFRAYPFPIPQSSLPSLRGDNLSQDQPFSAGSAPESYTGTPLPHHVQASSPSHASPTTEEPITPPTASEQEPLPTPGESEIEYTSNEVDLGQIDPVLTSGQSQEASELAASWCVADGKPQEQAGMSPRHLPPVKGKQRGADHLPEPSAEEMEAWCAKTPTAATFSQVELKSLPPALYPEGWIQVPVANPSDFPPPPNAYVLDGYAYAYTPGVYPDGSVQLPVYYATNPETLVEEYASLPDDLYFQFAEGTEPQPFFIGPDGGPMVPLEAMVVEETGPFLSEARSAMSPSDAEWTLRPTTANTAVAEEGRQEDASGHLVPRHISMSAFPPTPQSTHASSTEWTDRATSHAFAAGLAGQVDMDIGEEMMVWDQLPEETREDSGRSISSSTIREVSVKTARELPDRMTTPESLPDGRRTRARLETVA